MNATLSVHPHNTEWFVLRVDTPDARLAHRLESLPQTLWRRLAPGHWCFHQSCRSAVALILTHFSCRVQDYHPPLPDLPGPDELAIDSWLPVPNPEEGILCTTCPQCGTHLGLHFAGSYTLDTLRTHLQFWGECEHTWELIITPAFGRLFVDTELLEAIPMWALDELETILDQDHDQQTLAAVSALWGDDDTDADFAHPYARLLNLLEEPDMPGAVAVRLKASRLVRFTHEDRVWNDVAEGDLPTDLDLS